VSSKESIVYPFLPAGRKYEHVSLDHPWMQQARDVAWCASLHRSWPVGAVIVAPDGSPVTIGGSTVVMAEGGGGGFVAAGANGSAHHARNGCERERLGSASGQDYDLCEGCHPVNHAESKAVAAARTVGITDLRGYHLYLWGHWWCCKDCWSAMEEAGIGRVFLMEGSERLFNKEHPENIVGRQFEAL
jgi:tRNA(Arg) A34 adenosine deaminase TadA